MAPIHLRVRYRPIRIGWCVRAGNMEEVRKAIRLSHTLWGGRFNPIIPLGDIDLARSLVKVFRVDCLYCISETVDGAAVREEFKHFLWPDLHKKLFVQSARGGEAVFLDAYHPIRHLHTDNIQDRDHPRLTGVLYQPGDADPLADVLLMTVGGYPSAQDIGKDYAALFTRALAAPTITIPNNAPLPRDLLKEVNPAAVAMFDLEPIDYQFYQSEPGLYYGSATDFVVNSRNPLYEPSGDPQLSSRAWGRSGRRSPSRIS